MSTGYRIHQTPTKTENHSLAGKGDFRRGIWRVAFEHFQIVMILLILTFFFLPARASDNAVPNILQKGASVTRYHCPVEVVDDLSRSLTAILARSFERDNLIVPRRASIRAKGYVRKLLRLPDTVPIYPRKNATGSVPSDRELPLYLFGIPPNGRRRST